MNRHTTALEILRSGTVIPAIPLVLDENRRFDEAGQRRLIRYYLACGVGGVAVAVHTTQFAIRAPEVALFEPVLRVASEEFDAFEARTGRVLVRVAGVCGEVPQACAEAELARRLGFDAVLLSPGGLDHRSEAELVDRTRAVADALPVIGFYLQQACGGRRLSCEYWQAVADIPQVAAIKCASFNRYQTIDLVRGVAQSARRKEVALYTGNDDNIVADLLTKDGRTAVCGRAARALVGLDAPGCRAVRRAAPLPGRPADPARTAGPRGGDHRLQRRVF